MERLLIAWLRLTVASTSLRHHTERSRTEHGSVSMEYVYWAVGVLALATAVFAVIKTFVDGKIALIG